MSYCTAAQVKQLSYLITDLVTNGVIADADITALAAAMADPEIDAALSGYGAPFSAAPTLVQMISALLTAATLFEDRLSHTDNASGWAKAKREQAADLLERIMSGEVSVSGVTAPPLVYTSDPEDDRPKTEVFAGEDYDWKQREETRES